MSRPLVKASGGRRFWGRMIADDGRDVVTEDGGTVRVMAQGGGRCL
jgi:hypothetical protein